MEITMHLTLGFKCVVYGSRVIEPLDWPVL